MEEGETVATVAAAGDKSNYDFYQKTGEEFQPDYESSSTVEGRHPANVIGEIKGYEKYFCCPKISTKERFNYLDFRPKKTIKRTQKKGELFDGDISPHEEVWDEPTHPTIKPAALMDYLIKLVTPKGGHILDPFLGSGSTGMAALKAGYKFTGIDSEEKYVELAMRRIMAWIGETKNCDGSVEK